MLFILFKYFCMFCCVWEDTVALIIHMCTRQIYRAVVKPTSHLTNNKKKKRILSLLQPNEKP